MFNLIRQLINNSGYSDADREGMLNTLNQAERSQRANTDASFNAARGELEKLMTVVGAFQSGLEDNQRDLANFYNEVRTQAAEGTLSLEDLRQEAQRLNENIDSLTGAEIARLNVLNQTIESEEDLFEAIKKEMQVAQANHNVLNETNRLLKNKIGLGHEMTDSFLGSMVAGNRSFSSIATSISQALEPQRLFASALAQIEKATIQFNKELDTEMAALNKATAGTGQYNSELVTLTMTNRQFNADLKTSSEAIQGLNNNISMFNQMSADQRLALADTSVKLAALGVSGENAGKSFDIMINSLGMSQDTAQAATMELVGLAEATGVAADVVMKDFGQASSELAKYGKDMVEQFKSISGAAEATGVSISSLMSITKQFDTFEGAATSAGKLNAILGGGVINSMDLLNATEEERVRLLIQSMSLSGKNFENMNRFEKQAIANAAGITDMNEAQKLFTQSLSEYDMQVEKSKSAKATEESFNDMASAAISLSDKLKQFGMMFAVSFRPLITILSGTLDYILMFSDWLSGFVPTFESGFGKSVAAVTGFVFNLVFSIGLLYLAFKSIKKVIAGAGSIIGDQIASASEAASSGIKMFAKALKKSAKPISKALQVIGKGAMSAAPGLMAMGVGLIKVGLGVALIVLPIALLVASIAMLINSVITLAKEVGGGQLMQIASAFYMFAVGLGSGLALISASFLSFVVTLSAVAYAGIGIVPILTGAFAGLAAVIGGIALALMMIPNEKLINLSVASEGLAKVMDTAVKLTPEAVEHTKEIVAAAAQYVQVQAEMLAPDADSFVQAIKGALGGGGQGGGQDIVLVMNDREFARAVNVAINRTNNLSID